MYSFLKHYNELLAEHYSWAFAGREKNIQKNLEFFKKYKIVPERSTVAMDLGAGSGFQSIPLAHIGFKVIAIDLCEKLLDEIRDEKNGLDITLFQDDLLNFQNHCTENVELIVCMGDTLTHLPSLDEVGKLINKISASLEPGGWLVLTFRDLTKDLQGTDRIVPVRSSEDLIFSCFLEYEKDRVRVNDIVHQKIDGQWNLKKSSYQKIKIPPDWLLNELKPTGLPVKHMESAAGLITLIARK